jgi:hypothetical protein
MIEIGSFFNAVLSGFLEGLTSRWFLTGLVLLVSSIMFARSKHNTTVNDKNASIYALVRSIHAVTEASGDRFVFGVTGGGSTALSYLMSQFGASNTVIEFNCTYACESTREYVQPATIGSFASLDTAMKLAFASLKRCIALLTMQSDDLTSLSKLNGAIGIGATASLASKAWKRGEHRIFIALTTNDKEITFSLNLFKGVEGNPFRTREQEDDLCGKLIVCITAYACGLLDNTSLVAFMMANGLDKKDTLVIGDVSVKNSLESHLAGVEDIENVLCIPSAVGGMSMVSDVPLHLLGKYAEHKPKIVALPGSFNPLHDGHEAALRDSIALLRHQQPDTNLQGLFEMSVFNVDKPPLGIADLAARLEYFRVQSFPVFLTKTPRFIDKARTYPGMSYVIGVDTLIRLLNPEYTGGSIDLLKHFLLEMTSKGTEFFVFSRTFGKAKIPPSYRLQLVESAVLTYTMIREDVPYVLRQFFKEVPTNEHVSVSSSAIRKIA